MLNQAVPYIAETLRNEVSHFDTCTGKDTHDIRELFGIMKDHDNDAVCIAAYGAPVSKINDTVRTYEVKQCRRHDRARIRSQRERTYCVQNGYTKTGKPRYKAVAKNRRHEAAGIRTAREEEPALLQRHRARPPGHGVLL